MDGAGSRRCPGAVERVERRDHLEGVGDASCGGCVGAGNGDTPVGATGEPAVLDGSCERELDLGCLGALDGQRGGFAVADRRERFERGPAPLLDAVERRATAAHHLVVGDADDVDPNVAQLLVSDAVRVGVVLGAVELDRERLGGGRMAEQEVAPARARAVSEAGSLEERVEWCLRREPVTSLGSEGLWHPPLQEHRFGVAIDERVGVAWRAVERRVEREHALPEGLR